MTVHAKYGPGTGCGNPSCVLCYEYPVKGEHNLLVVVARAWTNYIGVETLGRPLSPTDAANMMKLAFELMARKVSAGGS